MKRLMLYLYNIYWLYTPTKIWYFFHQIYQGVNRLLYMLGRRSKVCNDLILMRPGPGSEWYMMYQCTHPRGHGGRHYNSQLHRSWGVGEFFSEEQ